MSSFQHHIPFPSIGAYRDTLYNVRYHFQFVEKDEDGLPIFDNSTLLPTVRYEGTVKCHGTNAGIVLWPDNSLTFQSRTRILSIGKDNHSFYSICKGLPQEELVRRMRSLSPNLEDGPVTVFCELVGKGVQGGGISLGKIDKALMVLGTRIGIAGVSHTWLEPNESELSWPEYRIFPIRSFPLFSVDIDFSDPEAVLPEINRMTDSVAEECPVGAALGSSGPGEGIVWCPAPRENIQGYRYAFKTKNEKFLSTKPMRERIPINAERANSIAEFVSSTVTANRLNQGLEYLRENGIEPSKKATGPFLKWVYDDIIKEEEDTLIASGFSIKDVSKPIGDTARNWFFTLLETTVFPVESHGGSTNG